MEVLYEDNHIIIVNKDAGEIVQGDKTGDRPLSDQVKAYIRRNMPSPVRCFSVSFIAWIAPSAV